VLPGRWKNPSENSIMPLTVSPVEKDREGPVPALLVAAGIPQKQIDIKGFFLYEVYQSDKLSAVNFTIHYKTGGKK